MFLFAFTRYYFFFCWSWVSSLLSQNHLVLEQNSLGNLHFQSFLDQLVKYFFWWQSQLTFVNLSHGFILGCLNSLYQLLRFTFSVQFSRSVVSDSLHLHGLQYARLPCPSPSPGACSNSCPSSWWCHSIILSSVVPFFSCLQSFPASGAFPRSEFFISDDQSVGVSASTSVLPMKIQDWIPLGLTGWISLQSKGLSRVFSNTTVQKHQFFGAQLSSYSNSHIHTWLLEKP